MNISASKQGEPFDLLYLRPEVPLQDAPEFRVRLFAFLRQHENFAGRSGAARDIVEYLQLEAGYSDLDREIPLASLQDFFANARVGQVLGCITRLQRMFDEKDHAFGYNQPPWRSYKQNWLDHVRRVFREHHLAYDVDAQGGVHPIVDQQFMNDANAAIRALANTKYSSALHDLNTAQTELAKVDRNFKTALCHIFQAVESLAKKLTGAARLTANEAKDIGRTAAQLEPLEANRNATNQLGQSFASWVNAIQEFRHAQEAPSSNQPSERLAIAMISQGYGWLRWLIDIDAARE